MERWPVKQSASINIQKGDDRTSGVWLLVEVVPSGGIVTVVSDDSVGKVLHSKTSWNIDTLS
jgi:hypothetical protein